MLQNEVMSLSFDAQFFEAEKSFEGLIIDDKKYFIITFTPYYHLPLSIISNNVYLFIDSLYAFNVLPLKILRLTFNFNFIKMIQAYALNSLVTANKKHTVLILYHLIY